MRITLKLIPWSLGQSLMHFKRRYHFHSLPNQAFEFTHFEEGYGFLPALTPRRKLVLIQFLQCNITNIPNDKLRHLHLVATKKKQLEKFKFPLFFD